LNHVQHKETFAELMENIYRYLIEYVVEMVVRNALPGLGDGGGLSASGYAEIAERVRADLEKMKLTGKTGKW
jgi:lysophospholipase L1-like esterase